MLAALALALLIAAGVGFAAYALTSPDFGLQTMRVNAGRGGRSIPPAELIFFSIFSMTYLLWVTLPLSIGSSRQFDPGHLLLYPISFRKLFAVDFISEIASLQSVFAIPAILAVGVGVGLARGKLATALTVAIIGAAFGAALSKCVSISLGSLLRKKRTRGETMLALMGAVAGLAGVALAQIAPALSRHVESIGVLRWTPPGAIAYALTDGLNPGQGLRFILSLILLTVYTLILVGFTYWLSHRAIFGGGRKKRSSHVMAPIDKKVYSGWEFPLASSPLSALLEKELRYASRNAQLRMMAMMPLILIVIRLMNRRFDKEMASDGGSLVTEFLKYGEGLMATAGILYIFLILTGLSCNLFAFEHAGMRTLILSPVDRRQMLVAKNMAITTVALILSIALMVISQLAFHDITPGVLLFGALSFVIYAALISVIGNWLSIRFPKRMKIGTRMNVSGVVGLLLIPMILLLGIPPLAAVAAGFIAQSLLVEYATLAVLALLSIGLYAIVIQSQGEALQKRELEVLEAVTDPGND
jgi:predicted permease